MHTPRILAAALLGAALILAAVMPAGSAEPPVAKNGQKFGKTLVAEYEIPSETLVKFAAFKASKAQPGESALVNSLIADTESWRGTSFKVSSTANPYTVVVTVDGQAAADGDVATLWQAGWTLDDGVTRLGVIPNLSKPSAKAGEKVSLVGSAAPISFKDDREIAVSLGLVSARNLGFDSVRVQVWSGIANPSFLQTLMSLRWLMLGLAAVVLTWWLRR